LTEAARENVKLNYSNIAPSIDTNPLSVGRALDPIQNYCLENKLPPLTAIVIGKSTHKPGHGFIAWDIDDIDAAFDAVFEFNWDGVQNPYENFGPKDTIRTFARRLIRDPNAGTDVYAQVKVRGVAQDIFRAALLKAYKSRCAMCELSFPQALEAAHIITWGKATPDQRLNPKNGLLLCSSHHRLFDAGVVTVSESLRIVVDEQAKTLTRSDRRLLDALIGKKLKLPDDLELWPNPQWLQERHKLQKWEKLP